jgi:hypothetical protein
MFIAILALGVTACTQSLSPLPVAVQNLSLTTPQCLPDETGQVVGCVATVSWTVVGPFTTLRVTLDGSPNAELYFTSDGHVTQGREFTQTDRASNYVGTDRYQVMLGAQPASGSHRVTVCADNAPCQSVDVTF